MNYVQSAICRERPCSQPPWHLPVTIPFPNIWSRNCTERRRNFQVKKSCNPSALEMMLRHLCTIQLQWRSPAILVSVKLSSQSMHLNGLNWSYTREFLCRRLEVLHVDFSLLTENNLTLNEPEVIEQFQLLNVTSIALILKLFQKCSRMALSVYLNSHE